MTTDRRGQRSGGTASGEYVAWVGTAGQRRYLTGGKGRLVSDWRLALRFPAPESAVDAATLAAAGSDHHGIIAVAMFESRLWIAWTELGADRRYLKSRFRPGWSCTWENCTRFEFATEALAAAASHAVRPGSVVGASSVAFLRQIPT